MPDFTAHYLFGDDVVKSLWRGAAQALGDRNAYHWGLQGPDLLLFSKAAAGGSPLPKYSNAMHSHKCGEAIRWMENYIRSQPDGEQKKLLEAYFYGYLCHYCLDRTVHPFVFYQEKKMCEKSRYNYMAIHCLIEAEIDSKLYRHLKGEPVTRFHPAEHYRLDRALEDAVAKMYAELLRQNYGFSAEESDIKLCFDSALHLTKLLYDPTRTIVLAARVVERLEKKPGVLSSHFKKRDIAADVLNEQHGEWIHFGDPDRRRNDSVLELFDAARTDAVGIVNTFAKRMNGMDVPVPGGLDIPFSDGNYQ